MIELPGEISTLNLFGKLLGRIPGRKRDSPEKYFHVELLTPRTPDRFLLNKTKIISWRKQVWLNLGDCFSTVIWQIILLFSLFMASVQFSSVQFSCSMVSDSLRPHESQHARPPCPSPTPGVHPDSRLSSQWCHPAISFSVVPFSSCPKSLPASESFLKSLLQCQSSKALHGK